MKRLDDFDLQLGKKKGNGNDFVKNQKAEREKRAQSKKENQAASKIQSMYRRSKIVEGIYLNIEKDFRKKIQDVLNLRSIIGEEKHSKLVNAILLDTRKFPLRDIMLLINKRNLIRSIRVLPDITKLFLVALRHNESSSNLFSNILIPDRKYPFLLLVSLLFI